METPYQAKAGARPGGCIARSNPCFVLRTTINLGSGNMALRESSGVLILNLGSGDMEPRKS